MVIPSRDRPALLATCLEHVARACDEAGEPCEVVVVDDGSVPPLEPPEDPRVRVVRTPGVGPSRARNAGVEAAAGAIVCFTDDDVEVDRHWVREALRVLRADEAVAGVTGRTDAPPYDPLYEHAVADHDGGSFLTCNVAYRASALRAVGGFDRQFPHAAHEDRDLAWRVAASVGPVAFAPEMRVVHPGRPFSARQWDRRGRLVVDDWLLYSRFPGSKASRLPVRYAPLASMARRWWRIATAPSGVGRSPARAARLVRLAGGQFAVGAWTTLTQWRHVAGRAIRPTPGLSHPGLRIAYVGPVPNPAAGGAPGVAGLLLVELLAAGATVDCYAATSRETGDVGALAAYEGFELVARDAHFGFGRWYSRHRLTKMASHQVTTAIARRRLAATLAARHHAVPYDVCYQFSNVESFGVPPSRHDRPPLVVHPSVHAAGELRWLRNERVLAAGLEGARRTALVRAWLTARSVRQRRDARAADRVLALSRAFERELVADYGLDPARVGVVPNCIDLERFQPGAPGPRTGPDVVLSVGRLTVRKGLEDVVLLSHALRDRAGAVQVRVVGAPSLWSDYSGLLTELDGEVGIALGHLERDEVADELRGATCLVQLSRYEPFGLTVAEALACGVPVVVTPAVGAAEDLPDDVARVVEPGDVAGLVAAVTELTELADDERAFLAARCRTEAKRFAPATVAARLDAELRAAIAAARD